jgi:hypothetical protein
MLVLLAAMAAFFALQAFYLAFFANNMLPEGDIWWWFVLDYFPRLDGSYHLSHLFARHNEHIIFTTRVSLFLDAHFFRLNGVFPIALAFVALLLLAVIFGALVAGTSSRRKWAFATIIFLGLTWAIAQEENLALEFQLGWLLVHLFAAACILAAAKALTARQEARWRWYALAFVADFLAIFSLASGLLLIVPLLAMPLWLWRMERLYVALILFHICLAVVYAMQGGGASPAAGVPMASLHEMMLYLFLYLGSGLGGLPGVRIPAGAVIVLFLAATAAWGLWRSVWLRTPFGVDKVTLLALGVFILCEAAVTTYGRSFFGIAQAASGRYGTASLIAMVCIFGLAWRFCRNDLQRIPVVALLGCAIWASNAYYPYVYAWLYRTRAVDDVTFALINGTYPTDKLKMYSVITHPEQFRKEVRRIILLGLGPFSATASKYQLPTNQISALDLKLLPRCKGHIDDLSMGTGMLEAQGWAASPTKTDANWILAYDGGDRLVGYTRASFDRPDVAAALPDIGSGLIGFDLFLRRDRLGEGLHLVVLSGTGPPSACTMPLKLPASSPAASAAPTAP